MLLFLLKLILLYDIVCAFGCVILGFGFPIAKVYYLKSLRTNTLDNRLKDLEIFVKEKLIAKFVKHLAKVTLFCFILSAI